MNIILGSGISGLLMLEILRDKNYVIFTNDVNNIGGQMKTDFPLGPRILHYSEKVNKFLKSIGIEKEPRVFKIGYYVNGKVVEAITNEQKLQYYMKTRGNNKINKTTMSEGKNEIIGWDINDINLVNTLYERNKDKIKQFDVVNINPISNYINFGTKYTSLISTIPLEVLIKLVDVKDKEIFDLKKKEVYFHHIKYKNEIFGDKHDYIYNVTDPHINRMTKISDDEFVFEADRFIYHPFLLSYIKAKTQLVYELKLESYYGVDLVGRYAQYDHSIKSNNIIEKYW